MMWSHFGGTQEFNVNKHLEIITNAFMFGSDKDFISLIAMDVKILMTVCVYPPRSTVRFMNNNNFVKMTNLTVILFLSIIKSATNEAGEFLNESNEDETYPMFFLYVYSTYILLAFSTATIIYGVVSWSLIRKFRNINNYVFLSASLANAVRLVFVSVTTLYEKSDIYEPSFAALFFFYITMVYQYLLLVMCYMFYVHIVKVFHKDVTRKYLKASFFAWGVPILLMIACCIIFAITVVFMGDPSEEFLKIFMPVVIIVTCDVLPAIFNTVIFVKVIWSLFVNKTSHATVMSENARRKDILRRLLLATAIFVLSNFTAFSFTFWKLFDLPFAIRVVTLSLQTLVVSLFVPFLRNNRDSWQEYLKNRVLWTLP